MENGWSEYQKLVLSELKRLSVNQEEIYRTLDKMREHVAELRVKSGLWGTIGGGLVAVSVLLWKKIFH